MLSRALVLAAACCVLMPDAIAQSSRRAPPPKITPPEVMAKVYRRPLLRPGRIQFCLRERGDYEGRVNGRMSPATERGLRRFRDDLQFKGTDVETDWALHAALWRGCRNAWTQAGGALDRFGIATSAPVRSVANAEGQRRQIVGRHVDPASAVADVAISRPSASSTVTAGGLCLSSELRDVLGRVHGTRRDIPVCDGPCLPLPSNLDREDAQDYERKYGITWCKSCVTYGGQLALDDIARIEKAGNLTLCPVPRRQARFAPGTGGGLMIEALKGTRSLFRRDIKASEPHNGLAIVIGVANYGGGIPPRPRAERDMAAMQALLTERLGYRGTRVIELKDPTGDELDGVFGRSGGAKGWLAERLKDAGGSPLFIYFSGLGAIGESDDESYLLPADAIAYRERARGLALETLYRNVMAAGAGSVTIVLEADFSADGKGLLVPPNAASRKTGVLPNLAVRGLTVMTSADRDQRPLEDGEYGLSLFTRHLVAGLSGFADVAPIGNGDGVIDAAEAFVYAAHHTSYAARKLNGVLQRATISHGKPAAIGRIGVPSR